MRDRTPRGDAAHEPQRCWRKTQVAEHSAVLLALLLAALGRYRSIAYAAGGDCRKRKAAESIPAFSGTAHAACHRRLAATAKRLEPTIGLEPMTCRLRIGCSTN